MSETEPYVTAQELARALGLSVLTIKRLTREGLPSESWGLRVRRYRVSDCVEWLRERETAKEGSKR